MVFRGSVPGQDTGLAWSQTDLWGTCHHHWCPIQQAKPRSFLILQGLLIYSCLGSHWSTLSQTRAESEYPVEEKIRKWPNSCSKKGVACCRCWCNCMEMCSLRLKQIRWVCDVKIKRKAVFGGVSEQNLSTALIWQEYKWQAVFNDFCFGEVNVKVRNNKSNISHSAQNHSVLLTGSSCCPCYGVSIKRWRPAGSVPCPWQHAQGKRHPMGIGAWLVMLLGAFSTVLPGVYLVDRVLRTSLDGMLFTGQSEDALLYSSFAFVHN